MLRNAKVSWKKKPAAAPESKAQAVKPAEATPTAPEAPADPKAKAWHVPSKVVSSWDLFATTTH